MFDFLLAVVAPHVCIQCGAEGQLWCAVCSADALPVAERCYKCHALSPGGRTCKTCQRKSPLFAVSAATRYEGYAKQLVWRYKFQRARAACQPIGCVMASRLLLPEHILMAHIPTATSRVRQRGYDQARLTACQVAKQTGLPHKSVLVHLGQKQQHGASRAQRLAQLDNAFRVIHPGLVMGRHIMLVDDVITTGATLEAAAKVLKAAGAKRVSAIIFAQA